MSSKSNISWTLVSQINVPPLLSLPTVAIRCKLCAFKYLAFSVGWTVLGFKPLSIFRPPNMPLKGFEPESLSHMLCILATLPVSTRVVTGRVAAMSNKCDKDFLE
jgi:hypothetical protein